MKKLRDVVAYLCKHYPHKSELSNARVTKMVYLADWRNALDTGRQMTEIEWTFDNFGPFVYDVVNAVRHDSQIKLRETTNFYGEPKTLFVASQHVEHPSLSRKDKEVLDFVIESTEGLTWDGFIRLVYSTYPVVSRSRYSRLNLSKLAEEYSSR